MEKIENQRRESVTDQNSQDHFSDFKPEGRHLPKQPENSMKYSYSITNKHSVDSYRPQFGHGPFAGHSPNEMSTFGKIKKTHGTVSYTLKKGSVNSEKVFKKNRILHYNQEENENKKHTSSMFKPMTHSPIEHDYLDLSQDQLVSNNLAPNITNLADESLGVSKNTKPEVYSAFLKYAEANSDQKSKNSQRTDDLIFFDDSSHEQIVHM